MIDEMEQGTALVAAGSAGDEISIGATDSQYEDLVRGVNQRWVGAPERVVVVRTAEDVRRVVREAVRDGKKISVRSGGHCFEDFVYNAETQVVIDMTELDEVYFDRKHRAVAVEAGATILRMYETLYKKWGVTVPAGFCPTVGMGGYVSGGGWGTLGRKFGLVVDHLYGVEVVTVDASGKARIVVATRDEDDPNRELWWAHTGGGGGSFGVVTRYLFRSPGAEGDDPRHLLPRPPREVILAAVGWSWASIDRAEFGRLARNYAQWHLDNFAPDNPNRDIAAFMGLNHRAAGQIGLIAQIDADAPDAEERLTEFFRFMNDGVNVEPEALTASVGDLGALPQFFFQRRLPWLQATRFFGMANVQVTDPTFRAEYKSTFMVGNFPEGQLDALHRHLTRDDINNPNVTVQLTPYGGEIAAPAPDDTASVHRGAAFKMLYSAYWTDPAEDDKHIGWARDVYSEVYVETGGVPVPNDVTDGCYVNYADIDLNDPSLNKSDVPWHDLYHKENYPRLQQAKLAYDPLNVFRHGQSVRLPGA
ncbi:FAD-binding protein [Saccharothrix sp.]|uniref:FAD-binding oxidoreductase n=1 Tax=Saccharothrix sp. TaxID=1873460 RepID=UPI0028110AC8|nr:FAD-binding protein [Saccharothrix sp.]